jgi:hypothetical protein
MGVILSGVVDWSTDRMFADAMKSYRQPSDFGSPLGQPPINSNGWPATDSSTAGECVGGRINDAETQACLATMGFQVEEIGL